MEREYLYDRPGVPGAAGSTWLAEKERAPYPPLKGIVSADVAVVGGGLCGVLTAMRCAETGARVCLVEGRRVGALVSGHTTAKATAQHGLVSVNVSSDARVPWLRANNKAVTALERWAARAGEDAAFERCDSHVYVALAENLHTLDLEEQLYREAGISGRLLEPAELPSGITGAVRMNDQALIDPVGLIDGLLADAPEQLTVCEHSIVQRIDEERDVVVVRTPHGEVRAGTAVVASHVPFFDTLLYMTRLFQYRHYALEVEIDEPAPLGSWYSEEEGAVAWRPTRMSEPRRIVVSGGGHKAGQGGDERERYHDLQAEVELRFGRGGRFLRHWSTQDAYTPDGLPYIGAMHGRSRCFMASGFGGWGMTASAVAADVLSTLVGNGKHELASVVEPARIGASGMVKLAVENADVVAKAFSEELAPEGEPDSVPPGEGRTLRSKEGHVAVAREADGTLHVKDAHCAHMRCGVEFNEAEGTWDCPCHGSRYYGDGSWLQGPTRRGLDPAPHPERAEAADG